MSDKNSTEIKEKKPYGRPQISRVRLVPEEATLQNCKEAGGATGLGHNKCLSGGCKKTGS
ncbi:MAG: hypothetical protein O2U61_00425 [Candidatus Bathyarchaeota archaeon]|jgi:hypothetical protein|nr:hypothetical protein [Candidatus Bathyarchaeota archaeon]